MRPTQEELSRLYRQMDSEMYERETAGRIRTARGNLAIVHRFLRTGCLLDVGCASGIFLDQAANAGWQVWGVEPAEGFAGRARKLLAGRGQVLHGILEHASLPAASFDAVTLWDVLEHVPDPVKFLQLCASLVKPGGYLFANVPNLDSLPARILGERWPLFLAEHLNYFNRSSLRVIGRLTDMTPVYLGRRFVSFSLSYVFYRLAQHRIPGSQFGYRLMRRSPLGRLAIPMLFGELCSVWRR